MELRDKVKELRIKADCGMLDAVTALLIRDGNIEFAFEYLQNKDLAVKTSDSLRYPKWSKYKAKEVK